MKRTFWIFVWLGILSGAALMQIQAASVGGGIRSSANQGRVKSVNGKTGDVTVTTNITLPLPNGDTTYLQLNSSQVVTGAPLMKVSSITAIGSIISTSGFVMGGGTLTASVVWPDGSIQSAAPAAASANNQAVNTATYTWTVCSGGGAVSLSTFPYISIPGCFFTTGNSTIEVIAVTAWTVTPSTALDANTRFNLKVATTVNTGFNPGNWYHRAATATVISSSNTLIDNIYFVKISTAFTIWPFDLATVDISSVPSGGAALAENWRYEIEGWKRP